MFNVFIIFYEFMKNPHVIITDYKNFTARVITRRDISDKNNLRNDITELAMLEANYCVLRLRYGCHFKLKVLKRIIADTHSAFNKAAFSQGYCGPSIDRHCRRPELLERSDRHLCTADSEMKILPAWGNANQPLDLPVTAKNRAMAHLVLALWVQ
jgi:hypothetical protein